MVKKSWKFRKQGDEQSIRTLAATLNISEVLASLLVDRKVDSFLKAKAFFRPTLDDLHDPFQMNGMEEASRRVVQAITNNELIIIHGDYDVDGTCAAALLHLFLKELGARSETYIPNRLTDGYGVSKNGIDIIKSRGTSLLITVDCGITANEEAVYAKSLGMDMVICDHHQPGSQIPQAFAVLDPLKPGCPYPFKYLSGAGVAFKLAQAVGERLGKRDLAVKYLDLVAIAGAADIVPLEDENRILVRKGMELVNTAPRPGIAALIAKAGMKPGSLTAGHVVFTIAPRINAAGRMGDASRAVELFTTNDPSEAERLASILENENGKRREVDENAYFEAMELVETTCNLDEEPAIVLHKDSWHQGVIGIVASRLVERYCRPAVMLTTVGGAAKGSARSIAGFNVYDALKQCEDILIQFGGHEAAAGLALELDKIEEFKRRFNKIVSESVAAESISPEILIDRTVHINELTPKFLRILEEFTPFGPGNLRPVFLAENVQAVTNPRKVGNNHLVVSVKQTGCDRVFDVIGFNLGEYVPLINRQKDLMDIVFTIENTTRDGRTYPQLRIKDIRIKQPGLEDAMPPVKGILNKRIEI